MKSTTLSQRAKAGLLLACAAVLAAAPGSTLIPGLRAAPTPAASASPSAAPIEATDTNTLRQHVGETITIHGNATKTGLSKTGTVAYLNFAAAHQGVALVFFLKPGQSGKASTEEDLKAYVGKPILVTGKLTEFKGDLQISVDDLSQIKDAP